MKKFFWKIKLKTTNEDLESYEEKVVEDWWMPSQEWPTLDDAVKDVIYNYLEWESNFDENAIEILHDVDDNCIMLKGRAIYNKDTHMRAGMSSLKKWIADRKSSGCVASFTYCKFFMITEEDLSLADLKKVKQHFKAIREAPIQ